MSNLKNVNVQELLNVIADFMNATSDESLPKETQVKKEAAVKAIKQLQDIIHGDTPVVLAKCTEHIPTLFGEIGGTYTGD